jgi:hypothetical protein
MSRFVRFIAFACAVLVTAALPAAADDAYTVKNIHVDASAVSSSEALNAAIAQGRPKAWQSLYRRLARQADWAKQPALDDLGIQRLMKGYTVANERRSTTRYTGDVTYIFNPDQVRRLLKNAGVAYAEAGAKRMLIIPMAPGYSKMSAWTVAWNNPKLLNGSVPLVLPVGDGADMAVLSKLSFENSTWGQVAGLAARAQTNEVALLLLNGGTVRIHHLSSIPIQGGAITDVPVGGGLAGATNLTQNALEDYSKMRVAIDFNHRLRQTVTARFDSLSDWGTLLAAMNSVPTVTGVDVVAINYGEARLGIVYAGTLDLVHDVLARAKINLAQTDGAWSVSLAPATQPAATP